MKREMLPTVDGLPPIFDKIVAVLPDAANPGVLFAYDGKVYGRGAPKQLTRELDAHERVHIERQYSLGVAAWWEKYLADPAFRYYEELLAHAEEYKTYCARHINPVKRVQFLRTIAKRLASGLYAAGVTVEQAAKEIEFEARGERA